MTHYQTQEEDHTLYMRAKRQRYKRNRRRREQQLFLEREEQVRHADLREKLLVTANNGGEEPYATSQHPDITLDVRKRADAKNFREKFSVSLSPKYGSANHIIFLSSESEDCIDSKVSFKNDNMASGHVTYQTCDYVYKEDPDKVSGQVPGHVYGQVPHHVPVQGTPDGEEELRRLDLHIHQLEQSLQEKLNKFVDLWEMVKKMPNETEEEKRKRIDKERKKERKTQAKRKRTSDAAPEENHEAKRRKTDKTKHNVNQAFPFNHHLSRKRGSKQSKKVNAAKKKAFATARSSAGNEAETPPSSGAATGPSQGGTTALPSLMEVKVSEPYNQLAGLESVHARVPGVRPYPSYSSDYNHYNNCYNNGQPFYQLNCKRRRPRKQKKLNGASRKAGATTAP